MRCGRPGGRTGGRLAVSVDNRGLSGDDLVDGENARHSGPGRGCAACPGPVELPHRHRGRRPWGRPREPAEIGPPRLGEVLRGSDDPATRAVASNRGGGAAGSVRPLHLIHGGASSVVGRFCGLLRPTALPAVRRQRRPRCLQCPGAGRRVRLRHAPPCPATHPSTPRLSTSCGRRCGRRGGQLARAGDNWGGVVDQLSGTQPIAGTEACGGPASRHLSDCVAACGRQMSAHTRLPRCSDCTPQPSDRPATI